MLLFNCTVPYRLLTLSFPFSDSGIACSPTGIVNFSDKFLQSIAYFRTLAYRAGSEHSFVQRLRSAKVIKYKSYLRSHLMTKKGVIANMWPHVHLHMV